MTWDFALAIRTIRKERGLTQRRLAELSGVSKDTIISYENGRKRPTAHRLGSLAKAMNVSISRFYSLPDLEDCDEVLRRLYFENPPTV